MEKSKEEKEQMAKLTELSKQLSPELKKELSKFALDVNDLKSQTIPDPVVTGGIEEIGLKLISPYEIPKFLIMHPALPRGIEIKANRMIKLVDGDLNSNILINSSFKKDKEKENINFEDGTQLTIKEMAEMAKKYCKDIIINSGGPLFLKGYSTEAYRFGTSFAVLQSNKAESEILRFEIQHPIFFGPAKYPGKIKGTGVDWEKIPQKERSALSGKMKIDPKTKKIDKYTQLTKRYDSSLGIDNYNVGSNTFINTRTNPQLKQTSSGILVPIGNEIDQSIVMQLMFDRIGDEPLGLSLVQFLHLTIKYLLNMERAGAQTMVNFGFNKWIANTPFKDIKKMKLFGNSLANIQKDSVVVLPKDIEMKNIAPGTTEFDKIHPIYLRLIAMRLGIPMPILTQDGTCYTEDTQTLTRSGWKYWYEIKEGEEIANYNKDTNTISFDKPKDLMVYDYDGIVYEFDNKCTNFCVTPNHNVLMRTYSKDSEYKTVKAKDIENEYITVKTNGRFEEGEVSDTIIIPAPKLSHNSIYKDIPKQEFDKKLLMSLFGWYFSEGCVVWGQVRITQNEGKNSDEIRKILTDLKLEFSEIKDERNENLSINFRIKNVGLAKYLDKYGKHSYEKRLPGIIKNANKEYAVNFLDCFRKGDGNVSKIGHVSYFSSSEAMINDLQYMVFKQELKSKIRSYNDNRYDFDRFMYCLSVHKNTKGETILVKDENVIEKMYVGKIFCFETNTGFFITRRNGKIAIQGNSTNKATIQEQRKDMWDDFIADEFTIESSLNDGFFKACQYKWSELTVKQLNKIVPRFKFNQPPEDIDMERERDLKFTLAIRNLANAAEIWTQVGDERVLARLSIKSRSLIDRSMELDYMEEKELKVEEERMLKLISTKQKLISIGNNKRNDEDITKQLEQLEKEEAENNKEE